MFHRCLKCEHRPPYSSGCRLNFRPVRDWCGIRFIKAVRLPAFGQTKQLAGGHLDESKHLTALGDQSLVLRSNNFESTPESHAFQAVEPTFHDQSIAELSRTPIADLSAHHHRISLRFVQFRESQAKFFREKG